MTIVENKAHSHLAKRRTTSIVQSTYTNNMLLYRSGAEYHHGKESSLSSKKGNLAVDLENMTITSKLTNLKSSLKVDKLSASSLL